MILTDRLDDDPTGSQSVHGLEVVTQLHEAEYRPAMDDPAGAFFVLTNSRSLPEPDAAALDERVADDLFRVAADKGRSLELVSRSDSTLRGHVIAGTRALDAARRRAGHGGYHAVLLTPAFLEAGRVTVGDTHWARAGSQFSESQRSSPVRPTAASSSLTRWTTRTWRSPPSAPCRRKPPVLPSCTAPARRSSGH